jgi:hypothetical protein
MIRQVEDLLLKSGKFRLPSQRQLDQPGWEGKVVVVDVGEMEIERRQKNRNARKSGFSKCHTLKVQVLVEFDSGQVIWTAVDTGKTHDFKLPRAESLAVWIIAAVSGRPTVSGVCQTSSRSLDADQETSKATFACWVMAQTC